MKPKTFPESNHTFVLAPEQIEPGRQDKGELPVFIDNANHQIVSCWQLTPEEIEHVKDTGEIWLGIMGGQPPVWLSAERPFEAPTVPVEDSFTADTVLSED